jgi:hypothetical protein
MLYDYLKKYYIKKIINDNNIIFIADVNEENKVEKVKYNIVDINNEVEFMKVYSKFELNQTLNIVLHCRGGDISSSDAIINILHLHNGIINIYIPMIAYSAASMIALCGDNIYMNNYALISPVDPQIDFGTEEEENMCPVKSYIKIVRNKGIKNLDSNFLLKYYECKSLYEDNLRNMKKILLRKYSRSVVNNLVKNLGYGIYPHEKQFNIDDLNDLGLKINIPVPKNIMNIYDCLLKFMH